MNTKEILNGLQDGDGEIIYKGSRNTLEIITFDGKKSVVKTFGVPNFFNRFIYGNFRKSKAQRSFENAKKLLRIGVYTPEPKVYFEQKNGLLFGESYYISDYISYDCTIREVLYQENFLDARKIIRSYTETLFKLHENGMEFIDNTPGNFLIFKEKETYQIFLVDLNRMKFGSMNLKKRMRNLAKITDSTEKLSWIAEDYAELSNMQIEGIKGLLFRETHSFQKRLQRKNKLKKRLKFWRRN